jgi:hypothetical protein
MASVRGLHKYECRVIFMTGRSEKRVSCMSSAGVIVSESACNVHALLSGVHISFALGCQVFTKGIDQRMVFGAFDTLWACGLTVTFGGTCCPRPVVTWSYTEDRSTIFPRNVGDWLPYIVSSDPEVVSLDNTSQFILTFYLLYDPTGEWLFILLHSTVVGLSWKFGSYFLAEIFALVGCSATLM